MQNNYEFIVLEESRKPNVYAISSLCEDGKHIIIWDFDVNVESKNLCKIENSLKNIQRMFLLSKIYILESRCGYNAICLDKLDKNEVANIKNLTSFDDKKHLEQGIIYNWKLRIGKDKKYVSYVDTEKFSKYTRSNAHRVTLNKMFGMDVDTNKFFDDSRGICLYSYWDWKCHIQNGNKQQQLKPEDRQEDEFSYTNR